MSNAGMKLRDRDRWMVAVLAHPRLTPTQKNVAVRLALHLNMRTGRCDPSLAGLAERVMAKERVAYQAIGLLEREGLIQREGTKGGRRNAYRLLMQKVNGEPNDDTKPCTYMQGSEPEPCTPAYENPARQRMRTLHVRAGEQSIRTEKGTEKREINLSPSNRIEERTMREEQQPDLLSGIAPQTPAPKKKPTAKATAAAFEEFWRAYPRRVARAAAAKAYARIVSNGEIKPADLLAGARRYANERAGKDPEFTKHPATWLNGGCWHDEPAAPKPNGHGQVIDQHGNPVDMPAEHQQPGPRKGSAMEYVMRAYRRQPQ